MHCQQAGLSANDLHCTGCQATSNNFIGCMHHRIKFSMSHLHVYSLMPIDDTAANQLLDKDYPSCEFDIICMTPGLLCDGTNARLLAALQLGFAYLLSIVSYHMQVNWQAWLVGNFPCSPPYVIQAMPATVRSLHLHRLDGTTVAYCLHPQVNLLSFCFCQTLQWLSLLLKACSMYLAHDACILCCFKGISVLLAL